MPARLPARLVPIPLQRSAPGLTDGAPAAALFCGAGGLICVEPPECAGGFGRFVMSEISALAFGTAMTRMPAIEAGCGFELACVAAALQAVISSADATTTA